MKFNNGDEIFTKKLDQKHAKQGNFQNMIETLCKCEVNIIANFKIRDIQTQWTIDLQFS